MSRTGVRALAYVIVVGKCLFKGVASMQQVWHQRHEMQGRVARWYRVGKRGVGVVWGYLVGVRGVCCLFYCFRRGRGIQNSSPRSFPPENQPYHQQVSIAYLTANLGQGCLPIVTLCYTITVTLCYNRLFRYVITRSYAMLYYNSRGGQRGHWGSGGTHKVSRWCIYPM